MVELNLNHIYKNIQMQVIMLLKISILTSKIKNLSFS